MSNSPIIEQIRRVVLAGVGAGAVTFEKLEATVEELIAKGEITVQQGKALNEELKRDIKKRAQAVKEGISEDEPLTHKCACAAENHHDDIENACASDGSSATGEAGTCCCHQHEHVVTEDEGTPIQQVQHPGEILL